MRASATPDYDLAHYSSTWVCFTSAAASSDIGLCFYEGVIVLSSDRRYSPPKTVIISPGHVKVASAGEQALYIDLPCRKSRIQS